MLGDIKVFLLCHICLRPFCFLTAGNIVKESKKTNQIFASKKENHIPKND